MPVCPMALGTSLKTKIRLKGKEMMYDLCEKPKKPPTAMQ